MGPLLSSSCLNIFLPFSFDNHIDQVLGYSIVINIQNGIPFYASPGSLLLKYKFVISS